MYFVRSGGGHPASAAGAVHSSGQMQAFIARYTTKFQARLQPNSKLGGYPYKNHDLIVRDDKESVLSLGISLYQSIDLPDEELKGAM